MTPFLDQLRPRLRADFRLSLITVFGMFAVFAVTPFAVVRFLEGNWVAGIVDSLVVLGIVLPTIYAWRGGDIDITGLCIAVTNSVGALLVVGLLGKTGVFWLFPVLLANFFFVRPLIAGLVSVIAIVVVQWQGQAFDGLGQQITASVTLGMVSLLAYIFAKRTEEQRRALEEMAGRDPLTGARNRRTLDDELAIALTGHQRNGIPVALMVLDLDHFKAVNDRFGHEEGDRVLQAFVRIVDSATRATDRLFRYGGEEFVLLMPQTDEHAVERVFAKLQRRLHEGLNAGGFPVTASAGAAVLRHGETREQWFCRADEALYVAKQGGRDRIVVAAPDGASPV